MYHSIDIIGLLQSVRLFHKAMTKIFNVRELQKLKDEIETKNKIKNEIELVKSNPS